MSILTATLVGVTLAGEAPQVDVRLELRPGPAVGVVVAFPGEQDGDSVVSVSENWGGVSGAGREIAEVAAFGRGGAPLRVSRSADHLWTVRHAPGEVVTLEYDLTPHEREPLPPGHNDYRNVVREGLFHAIGNHALVLPDGLRGPARISLSWRGFEGWTVASSLGPGAEAREATLAVDEFRSCFLIAGAPGVVRLGVRELNGNQVGLAVIDADWGFADERLMDMVLEIVAAEREFFGDHTDPWFLVALTHNGGHAGEQGFSFGGTGLHNCFALFCNTGMDISPGGRHAEPVLRLLAHEYFHTWNGRKIRLDAPEGAAYWFSEGFTDFYARRILRRAGLIDDDQFLRSLNESLAAYDGNPERNAPNARIVEEFWKSQPIGTLPYQRGDLLALALDEAIAAASGGARSLDDLMRDLYQRSARSEPALTPDQFLELIAAEAGAEFAAAARACVIEGADPPLPKSISGGSLSLTMGGMRQSDDGFDAVASREAGVITGVREHSGAQEAGLRDGQRFVSMERLPPVAGPSRLRVVTADADGSERTTVFEAVGAPRLVRRYAPAGS